jgi:hypothetical protein
MKDLLEKEIKKIKKDESIRSETLLRDTTNHYIRLIGDSDRKARIMIVVNSILLTGSLPVITMVIHNQHLVWISAAIFIVANLMALFFTVMSVQPDLQNDINKDTENNMLHYKKCTEFSLADYRMQMLSTMHSNDKKIDAVIKELYFFGNLLDAKYRLMKVAYRFFLWGVIVSIVSYLIILFVTKSSLFK